MLATLDHDAVVALVALVVLGIVALLIFIVRR